MLLAAADSVLPAMQVQTGRNQNAVRRPPVFPGSAGHFVLAATAMPAVVSLPVGSAWGRAVVNAQVLGCSTVPEHMLVHIGPLIAFAQYCNPPEVLPVFICLH